MLLFSETTAMFESEGMQEFISKHRSRHSKRWIFEIIEGERESDAVLHRDSKGAFLLLPCMTDTLGKMKGHIAICTDPSLRCLRDLRGEHVPMLERLRDECLAVLPDNVAQCSIHYHPSVYQLHVHFRSLEGKSIGPRVHLLNDVIANLRADSEYYRKATLVFSMPCSSDINKVFTECTLAHVVCNASRNANRHAPKCCQYLKHTGKTNKSGDPTALRRGVCIRN